MCAAAADLERMSDKLPLAKLGTAAVYSCGKLALLDEPGCDVNTYDMRLPAEKAAATCAKPACKDAMNATTLLSAASRYWSICKPCQSSQASRPEKCCHQLGGHAVWATAVQTQTIHTMTC